MSKFAMLDIETLGNEGKFIVTSVVMVLFDLENGLIENKFLHFNLELNDQIENGFLLSEDTLDWWTNMDPKIFQNMFKDRTSIEDVIKAITLFMHHNDVAAVYATAALDYQGISNLSDLVNWVNPISYDKRLCARTIDRLHASLFGEEYNNELKAIKNTHNPLEDCKNQVRILVNQMKNIKKCKDALLNLSNAFSL